MKAPSPRVTCWNVIVWWELRRIPYNLAVGITGLLSLLVMGLIGASFLEPGQDYVEPLLLIFGSLLFGILANAGYTLGWVVELKLIGGGIEDHQAYRKRFFRLGLWLSCAIATLPVWDAILSWIFHS